MVMRRKAMGDGLVEFKLQCKCNGLWPHGV